MFILSAVEVFFVKAAILQMQVALGEPEKNIDNLYRHAGFSDKVKAYVNAASMGSIGLAVALFLINLYYQFFG